MSIVKKIMQIGWSDIKKNYNYLLYRFSGNDYRLDVNIISIDQTLDYMEKPGNSIVRYGDGEFMLMCGGNIGRYQSANVELSNRLKSILKEQTEKLLVCLPEPFAGVEKYITRSKKHWILHNKESRYLYQSLIDSHAIYGNSFVSRPYLIYADKSKCKGWFDRIKNLFSGKDITIIEGDYSRTGVGNDLFNRAKSIERILCPPNNAFDRYNQILNASTYINKDRLVLVALGPTGKLLTSDLVKKGYWVFDIGHIDSEYEWFLMNATKKVTLTNKHTAEHNSDIIGECTDEKYLASIICRVE